MARNPLDAEQVDLLRGVALVMRDDMAAAWNELPEPSTGTDLQHGGSPGQRLMRRRGVVRHVESREPRADPRFQPAVIGDESAHNTPKIVTP